MAADLMATILTRRISMGAHNAAYDAWRESWGASWNDHWRVSLELAALGHGARVTAAATADITKRVTP